MPVNNSRITLASLLNYCNPGTDTEKKRGCQSCGTPKSLKLVCIHLYSDVLAAISYLSHSPLLPPICSPLSIHISHSQLRFSLSVTLATLTFWGFGQLLFSFFAYCADFISLFSQTSDVVLGMSMFVCWLVDRQFQLLGGLPRGFVQIFTAPRA